MVRVKSRYIVVKLLLEEGRGMPGMDVLGSVIKSRVEIDYGRHVLSMVGNLGIVEYLPHSQIVVIRCDAPVCKYVLFTITTIGEISGFKCSMSVLWVSGILKRAMRKILKYVRMEKR
ncbi:Rpp14/Pop5-like protein [Encephalitozoon hellem]|uniref:Ribonuclease P/MRP protein subunit POP5 n=1 Tax=Encephalitozoon hellem TaxID=27973 RepID=A0ABY8CKP3_ENCHE|nr:Rpp14/Pop5-like protein [Encephalitozoon hellem]WEL39454.1 RNAse P component 2 [Encephalitozoon hellem]